ncbi:MAG: outer membrane beta-barrel protein [Verrucomicrobiales bacterium]|nr:outer membrane beta-barrel protein [Verrucomicrobiales bacterium]MCP5559300.1 outer membrane beta-barrel protein [Verrucomicrobiaceae bacterium]
MSVIAGLGSVAFAQQDPSRLTESATSTSPLPTLREGAALDQLGLEEENAFAPPTMGDDDIGQQLILKETPRDRWFRAYADTFAFWTTNAANVSAGEQEDWYWGGRLGAGYQPRLTNRLFADIDLGQQFVRYDKFDALDFENLEASASLIYIEPKLASTLFFLGVQYQRITSDTFGDELYNSYSLRAGAQKVFLLNRRNSIHLSLMADWDLDTDVDQLYRDEYLADVAWRYKLMRDLSVGLSYRATWLDYREVDRQDWLHLAGVSISYQPRPWLEVYLAGSYALNRSNIEVFGYETSTVGLGLGVKLKF